MNPSRNRIRINQTYQSYCFLRQQIDQWFSDRKKADVLKQYVSQLKVLSAKLDQTLDKLSVQVNGLSPTQERGEVYQKCAAYEKYLLWVQRIWEYYRIRFDQRDQPGLRDVLAAADEIVWSCFHGMFPDPLPGASAEARYRPAPLPFIAADYSPQAVERPSQEIQTATGMSKEFQEKLDAYLKKLPIPTVSLPPSCVQFPWWLAFLGHEVGHQVQREVDVSQPFAELLSQAAAKGADPHLDLDEFVGRWAGWGNEIFADVFSLFMLGPSAYWAMMELNADSDLAMLSPILGRYPAPVIRLSLMRELVVKLGLEPDRYAALDKNDLDRMIDQVPAAAAGAQLQAQAKADSLAVPYVVDAILSQPVPPVGLLRTACGWSAETYKPGRAVYGWANLLQQNNQIDPEYTLEAAREIISAAVLAWTQISAIDDDAQRSDAERGLAERMLPLLRNSREPSTRAAVIFTPQAEETGEEDMADLLIANVPVS